MALAINEQGIEEEQIDPKKNYFKKFCSDPAFITLTGNADVIEFSIHGLHRLQRIEMHSDDATAKDLKIQRIRKEPPDQLDEPVVLPNCNLTADTNTNIIVELGEPYEHESCRYKITVTGTAGKFFSFCFYFQRLGGFING